MSELGWAVFFVIIAVNVFAWCLAVVYFRLDNIETKLLKIEMNIERLERIQRNEE